MGNHVFQQSHLGSLLCMSEEWGATLASEGELAAAGFLAWKLRPRPHSTTCKGVLSMVLPPPYPRPRKGSRGTATWRTSRTLGRGRDPPAHQAPPSSLLAQLLYLGPAPRRHRLSSERPTPLPTRGRGPRLTH